MEICFNVSSVVEFQRWWVLKCKSFAQESLCSKEIVSKQPCDELWFVKKGQNRTFNVNFLCQKSSEFFQKQKSFKNINLDTIFCNKCFLLKNCLLNWYSYIKVFLEKIQLIFDIENWLWKYNFGTFWGPGALSIYKI